MIKTNSQTHAKKDVFMSRIAAIDLIRGFCMCLVIFDHIMWNFQYFFPLWAEHLGLGAGNPLYDFGMLCRFYWDWDIRDLVRFFALDTFVLLSGVSVVFSKDNNRRCLKMIFVWFGMSIFTNIANGFWPAGCIINFNIIAVIACCVLLYCIVGTKTYRSIAATIMILSFIQFGLVPTLRLHVTDEASFLPIFWWPNVTVNGHSYPQADYMPLFPYIIAFFTGALFSIFYYKPKLELHDLGPHPKWERPFCFIGRNSLIIYLSHQIIFQAIFMAIGLMLHLPISY